MKNSSKDQVLLLQLIDGFTSLADRLNGPLANIRGISYPEFRLLSSIQSAPGSRISRVELAREVGLSPSGVTRALRPLEKLGFMTTEKSERDARLAIATLTPQGKELLSDAIGILNDLAKPLLDRSPTLREHTEIASRMAVELT